MKRKLFYRLTSTLCVLALLLGLLPTAYAEDYSGVSAPSKNINRPSYFTGVGSDLIRSYLVANEKGGLTRVEYFGMDEVVIEEFDSSFQFVSGSRKILEKELDVWGGFYAGKQYNFIIWTQSNPQESDSREVVRVVKYDKNWNRLGAASVYGANTETPTYLGCLRCAESGGVLYIHTSHKMYKTSDGVNHQAGFHITVRESDMTVTETKHTMSFPGYVSHSLNQFVITDQEGNLLTASHGDGYPRSLIIHKFIGAAGKEQTEGVTRASVETDRLPGGSPASTWTLLGGFAETSSGYLLSYTQQESGFDPQQVKLAYIAKSNFNAGSSNTFQTRQITNYSYKKENNTATYFSYPFLAPISLNGGYIIWSSWDSDYDGYNVRNRNVYYTTYDATGQTGAIQTAPGAISDCQPIAFNGKVVWYTTEDEAPVFYVLDESGLKTCQAVGPGKAATPLTSIGSAVSGATTAPSIPSTPGTPSQTNPAQAAKAVLSPQKLEVDGKNVDCEKYNIDGSNYFKLRDLAYVLNGTGSQFAVGFDAATSTVTITTGAAYTSNGTELVTGMDNSKTAQPSRQTILIDGVERGDLTAYNIGGSNFFKLRDLGDTLGFEVDFNAASNAAVVRSK